MLGGTHEEEATCDKMPRWDAGVLNCAALQHDGKPSVVTGTIEEEFKHSTGVCAAGHSLSQPRALGMILFFLGHRCEPTGLC